MISAAVDGEAADSPHGWLIIRSSAGMSATEYPNRKSGLVYDQM